MSLASLAEDLAQELGGEDDDKAEGTASELLVSLKSWLDQRRSSNRAALTTRMRELLSDGNRRTATEIAKELHIARKEANGVLYSSSEFQKSDDTKPLWGVS